jgi:hypothetical protein
MRRDCTTKFKIAPIRAFLRSRYGMEESFTQYIGIASEEAHRMRSSDVKYCVLAYPLVDAGIDRAGCVRICERAGFFGVVKSGCFCCPFTKMSGWQSLYKEHPDLFRKAVALEENCPNQKVRLASKPLRMIGERLTSGKGLTQLGLDQFDIPCDVAGGCFL